VSKAEKIINSYLRSGKCYVSREVLHSQENGNEKDRNFDMTM